MKIKSKANNRIGIKRNEKQAMKSERKVSYENGTKSKLWNRNEKQAIKLERKASYEIGSKSKLWNWNEKQAMKLERKEND